MTSKTPNERHPLSFRSQGASHSDTEITSLQEVVIDDTNVPARLNIGREGEALLQSLLFRTKEVRHAQIPEAHQQTFQWIFEDDTTSFCSWIRNDSGIFWISGKAASGKSTLMKLISDHSKTQQLLRMWSGTKKLILAKHFFWKPGEVTQKSRAGLLRSLLYDILKQCPELVPGVLTTLQHQSYDTWYLHELVNAFKSISTTASSLIRLFVIIDGLDEYESSMGYHLNELIEVIRMLSEQSWIKLCVSSRPWVNFQDAFGKDSRHWLKLEDLTHADIATYVRDTLDLDLFKEPLHSQLVKAIVRKAQGVFLWVYLAVRDIVQGMRDGERPSDLLQKMDELPSDLEDFLRRILHSIPPEHRKEAGKHFKLACHGLDGQDRGYYQPPLLIHTFVGELDDLEQFGHLLSASQWNADALRIRLERGRRRLGARCKGLLETSENDGIAKEEFRDRPFLSPIVHFFHRSIVELIPEVYVTHFTEFDSSAFICKVYNLMLENAYENNHRTVKDDVRILADGLIVSAMQAELAFGQISSEMIRWLQRADSIITQNSEYEGFMDIPQPPAGFPKMIFLETCTCTGYVSYVHFSLRHSPYPVQLSLRLLHTLNWCKSLKQGISRGGDIYRMRQLLLKQLDGNINLDCPCCSGSSPRNIWTCTLTSVRRHSIMAKLDGQWLLLHTWAPVFKMYLEMSRDALEHVVPFDDQLALIGRVGQEENPQEGIQARIILQRYVPRQTLQELGIPFRDSEGLKYSPSSYQVCLKRNTQTLGIAEGSLSSMLRLPDEGIISTANQALTF